MQDFRYAVDIPRRGTNRGETVRETYKGGWNVRTRDMKCDPEGKSITRSLLPSRFLTTCPFEELIASIGNRRRYRSVLWFTKSIGRTARVAIVYGDLFLFSLFPEYGISEAVHEPRYRLSRKRETSFHFGSTRTRFPVHLWIRRTWYRDA